MGVVTVRMRWIVAILVGCLLFSVAGGEDEVDKAGNEDEKSKDTTEEDKTDVPSEEPSNEEDDDEDKDKDDKDDKDDKPAGNDAYPVNLYSIVFFIIVIYVIFWL